MSRPGAAALTVLVSTLACWLAAEALLALLHQPFAEHPPRDNAPARFDEELGWAYVPDRHTRQPAGSTDHDVDFCFDHRGTRVECGAPDRDPARPSLLVVGDSFAMGHGLPEEDSVAGQLARSPGFTLQTVNLAVQGYGTDQALLMLERHIGTFDTRAVVTDFICDHLVRNANDDRRLLFPGLRFEGTKPMFELIGGQLVQTRHAHRYAALESRLLSLARVVAAHRRPPPSPEVTRALLLEMDRVARARGVPLVVVDWRMPGLAAGCAPGLLDGLGLHVVHTDDHPPAGWDAWTIPGDVHPDARAHHRVARLVLEELEALGVVPSTVRVATATEAASAG